MLNLSNMSYPGYASIFNAIDLINKLLVVAGVLYLDILQLFFYIRLTLLHSSTSFSVIASFIISSGRGSKSCLRRKRTHRFNRRTSTILGISVVIFPRIIFPEHIIQHFSQQLLCSALFCWKLLPFVLF